jgi:ML-like domain
MAGRPSQSFRFWLGIWTVFITLLSSCPRASAQGTDSVTQDGVRWIQYTGNDGTVWLKDNRRPSLYTQSFGDCQGDSLINVTRFDAAYYKDNMTVMFHLGGNTALADEDLMRKLRQDDIFCLIR